MAMLSKYLQDLITSRKPKRHNLHSNINGTLLERPQVNVKPLLQDHSAILLQYYGIHCLDTSGKQQPQIYSKHHSKLISTENHSMTNKTTGCIHNQPITT